VSARVQLTVRDVEKIERLVRNAERDARLLNGRDFKMRPWAEAYRLLDLLRDLVAHPGEERP